MHTQILHCFLCDVINIRPLEVNRHGERQREYYLSIGEYFAVSHRQPCNICVASYRLTVIINSDFNNK